MSFKTNSSQKISFTDSFHGLTSREQKALENSWTKTFDEDIFPSINEEPFWAIYSGSASRPNTPVNICIGVLIIKELFSLSDDEVVENLMLDRATSTRFIRQVLRNSLSATRHFPVSGNAVMIMSLPMAWICFMAV